MITNNQFQTAADSLQCDVATIKAVSQVESSGSGFLPDGKVKILFEPHIFWKQLRQRGIDPTPYSQNPDTADICYPVWGTKPYGPVSNQWNRLNRAIAINDEAALCAASWGAFQIMGFNYQAAGFNNVNDFVSAMQTDDNSQLMAFINYIKSEQLTDELMHHDWAGFARGYNGPQYTKNKYDERLKTAYDKFSGRS